MRPAPGTPNPVTGKSSPGVKCAATTKAPCETVIRTFYDFHLREGTGLIINLFPLRGVTTDCGPDPKTTVRTQLQLPVGTYVYCQCGHGQPPVRAELVCRIVLRGVRVDQMPRRWGVNRLIRWGRPEAEVAGWASDAG